MYYRNQNVVKRVGLVALAVLMGVGPTTPATGWAADAKQKQTPWTEIGSVSAEHEDGDEFSGGFKLQYQIGAWYRLTSSSDTRQDDPWLATIDLVGLVWDREHATWGLGGHIARDSEGTRIGLKGLWRTPLGMTPSAFFQVSPGVYVYADSGNERYNYVSYWDPEEHEHQSRYSRLDLPAFFCEAELAFSDNFSLLTALEVLPFEWSTSTDYGRPGSAVHQTDTLEWNVYAGAKIGQKYAVITTLLLAVAAGIALATCGFDLDFSGLASALAEWGYRSF